MKFILLFLSMTCLLQAAASHFRYSLTKAIALKKISVKATSRGGFQGYCINLQINNLSPDSIVIEAQPGLKFNSVKNDEQDILLVKQLVLPLKGREKKEVSVKGYCCQQNNRSPSFNSAFKIEENKDSNLVTVARFLDRHQFESGTEQHAVWAISDRNPTGSIYSEDRTNLAGLHALVAKLKNEPVPWYDYESSQQLYSNGVIASLPKQLNGTMHYNSRDMVFATLVLLNEEQVPVGQIKSGWLPPGVDMEYQVDLPIRGLTKGKYTAQLQTRDQVLVNKVFEL